MCGGSRRGVPAAAMCRNATRRQMVGRKFHNQTAGDGVEKLRADKQGGVIAIQTQRPPYIIKENQILISPK